MPRPTTPLVLLLAAILACCAPGASAEPEHATAAAADFRPDTRELQIILRLEPDEFEDALSQFARRKMVLENPESQRAAVLFLRGALQMMDKDGVVRELDFIEMQVEPAWVYVIVQFPVPRKTSGLQISNRLYFSRHDDQQNVLNVQIGAKESTLTFNKEHPWRPIAIPPAPEGGITPIPEIVSAGTGPIQMILIPTHSSDASMFRTFMERNAAKYTMHALTLPGMDGTAPPPAPLPADVAPWIDNAVAAAGQAIADLDLDRPVVLGAGLGGIVAYLLAIEHPETVGPIITLDAPPAMIVSRDPIAPEERRKMVDKIMKKQFDSATPEQWQSELRKLANSVVVEEDRRAELFNMLLRTAPPVGKEYLLEHMKIDLSEKTPQIQSPVLAIAALNNLGAASGIFPADIKRLWEAAFAQARQEAPDRFRIVFFEDTGQFITEERPKELDKAVATFLDDVE